MKMSFRNVRLQYVNQHDLFPVHLGIATKVIAKTGKRQGVCLELASGPGYLGFALAQLTKMDVYLLENSPNLLRLASKNIESLQVMDRVKTIKGRLAAIPFGDGTIDLIISQRSVFFWNDRRRIFQEIHRVLAPGGIAYVGSGIWSGDIKDRVEQKLADCHPKLRLQLNSQIWMSKAEQLETELRQSGIPSFEVHFDDESIWILIRKNQAGGFPPESPAG